MGVRRLVRVACEQPAARSASFILASAFPAQFLEGDVDRRPFGLQPATVRGGLGQNMEQVSRLAEDEDVGGERIIGRELTGRPRRLVVAPARQSVPGLQHVDIKPLPVPMGKEGDASREVQAFCEDRDLKAGGKDDVLATTRIEESGVIRAPWVHHRCRNRKRRQHWKQDKYEYKTWDRGRT